MAIWRWRATARERVSRKAPTIAIDAARMALRRRRLAKAGTAMRTNTPMMATQMISSMSETPRSVARDTADLLSCWWMKAGRPPRTAGGPVGRGRYFAAGVVGLLAGLVEGLRVRGLRAPFTFAVRVVSPLTVR